MSQQRATRPAAEARLRVARKSYAQASRHQEWLPDEALKETFPASDPISPARTSESAWARRAERG